MSELSIAVGNELMSPSERALIKASLAQWESILALPQIWATLAAKYPDIIALNDSHSQPEISLTYQQLHQTINQFAAGLQALDIQAQTQVALFADNSPRWLIADQGIMQMGAADVVRSSGADPAELLYILEDSNSQALVVENLKTLQKLQPEIEKLPIRVIILLSDQQPPDSSHIKTVNWAEVMKLGQEHSFAPVEFAKDNLATLLYTSGTTGKPKGVMLTHGNLIHQIIACSSLLPIDPGDRALSILPSWHAYERSCEYYLFSQGCSQFYTNIRSLKRDLAQVKPQYMIGVPRLWESIYEGVQKQFREQPASKQRLVKFFMGISEKYILAQRIATKTSLDHLHASAGDRLAARLRMSLLAPLHRLGDKLVYQKIRQATGGRMKTVLSGGGSLAKHLENFYQIIGIPVLVGYGLTETAPITNARTLNHNVRCSAGRPVLDTQIRIVDPETRQTLPAEAQGLVMIKGPQVMQGYYQKPEATAKVIDAQGWFDSGDLGKLTPWGDLVITGRAKDTIVLSNGENIEPQPIEDACARSQYIDQIILVGQDQRSLGALIVPNLEALQSWIEAKGLDLKLPTDNTLEAAERSDLYSRPILDLFRQELNREVKNRPGYRAEDRIGEFRFVLEPFSIDNGMMTQTLKVKRPVVRNQYQNLIDQMFAA